MKIYSRIEYTDNKIDKKVRQFGIRKSARLIGLSPSFLYGVLKDRQALNEKYYFKLKRYLK